MSQDAFGSPPPELPNNETILWPNGRGVNITSVIYSRLQSKLVCSVLGNRHQITTLDRDLRSTIGHRSRRRKNRVDQSGDLGHPPVHVEDKAHKINLSQGGISSNQGLPRRIARE
jgi:hypothetical protein